ncbi:thermonuclease family protein [Brucella intermedia]|uniref:thermonuclease family protein n=1 Tax=Brucella intermedia TaxID=94625 RepID=UPI002362BC14|nr:thermonuclease family protein [Brucella intermedia]
MHDCRINTIRQEHPSRCRVLLRRPGDRYGRTPGVVWVNVEFPGRPPHPPNVNASMVHQGMAWAYRFHGRASDPEILRLEQEARGKRVGL